MNMTTSYLFLAIAVVLGVTSNSFAKLFEVTPRTTAIAKNK